MNTHWKARFTNPLYLGVYSLYDDGSETPKKLKLTVKDYEVADIIGEGGRVTKGAHIMSFHEVPQKLILRPTNLKRIAAVLKTPLTNRWVGRQIVLQQENEYNRLSKQNEDVLRVSTEPGDYAAVVLPEIHPGHEKWEGMLAALAAGTTTVAAIKTRYSISPENEALITARP